MKLKICTIGKVFGKICLKAFRQYVVISQGRNGMKHERKGNDAIFWWGKTSNRRTRFKIFGMSWESPILIPNKKTS